eukprot:TRINITY_DN41719_c0_g1_i1.p1 TRINITY_DN41719_c0_g1~~TRINITY_DN41719_c0_g1_i1.p1  ORF type:complete len:333 (+),score=35.96 TRINITY_DN41719_c0_g1_i1:118-1116(+)
MRHSVVDYLTAFVFFWCGRSYSATHTKTYGQTLAKKLVLLSDAAYCGDNLHGGTDVITQWTCAACLSTARLFNIEVFGNVTQQTFGFTGVSDGWLEGQHVVVSFRGSVLNQNYIDDADTTLIPHPEGRFGMVHRGLFRAYSSMSAEMLQQVRKLMARYPAAQSILVTGHSLGAAEAVFAADDLSFQYPDTTVTVYSFGTPKVGDLAFSQRFNAIENLESWVVVHRADTVPQCGLGVPPCHEYDDYHQIARNVWYPDGLVATGSLDYIVCDDSGEDPHCQNSVDKSLLNWNDHNLYLKHTMYCCDDRDHGTSGEGCPFPFSSDFDAGAVQLFF